MNILREKIIATLKDSLENIYDEKKCIKNDHHNILSDKIRNNYEKQTINSIAKMLDDANSIKNSQDNVDALVNCVHKLLNNRDATFLKLMQDFNTTL